MTSTQVPEFVCRVLGVKLKDVFGRSGRKPSMLTEHVDARFIIIGIWDGVFKLKRSEMARRLKVDRKSILNAIDKREAWVNNNEAFRDKVLEVQKAWRADPC